MKFKKFKGLTLIEMMMVLVLFAFITLVFLKIFLMGNKIFKMSRAMVDVEQKTLISLEKLTHNIMPVTNCVISSDQMTLYCYEPKYQPLSGVIAFSGSSIIEDDETRYIYKLENKSIKKSKEIFSSGAWNNVENNTIMDFSKDLNVESLSTKYEASLPHRLDIFLTLVELGKFEGKPYAYNLKSTIYLWNILKWDAYPDTWWPAKPACWRGG